ncbi:MAG: Lipoate-protein ligase A [Firmicutes bacterium ADurb.Bin182]|nr:MAG: Lipoate-protein ligase A [Firmicutes bacterium ADurb.Bin182]
MINRVLRGEGFDPYFNLSLEEMLVETHPGGCTLYLWQNKNTVVIGKHQNAWRECRTELLEKEGGFLARRMSGGGAVYHDLGNLNFTFVADRELYDVKRQLGVILEAVRSFGIDAEFSGRNDLVTKEGAKFSGNAFRLTRTTGMHHGTILVNVDMGMLSRYLAPSQEKMAAKGVQSVRSRVCNLKELFKGMTIGSMADSVQAAFTKEYGEIRTLHMEELDRERIEELYKKYSSWEWRMGETPDFDTEISKRFAWGNIDLQLKLADGIIKSCRVYSDAMDEQFVESIAPTLTGCRYIKKDMAKRIAGLGGQQAEDIAAWLMEE